MNNEINKLGNELFCLQRQTSAEIASLKNENLNLRRQLKDNEESYDTLSSDYEQIKAGNVLFLREMKKEGYNISFDNLECCKELRFKLQKATKEIKELEDENDELEDFQGSVRDLVNNDDDDCE